MYLIIYYNTFFINFLGQQHLTILRLRVGGGGPGVLVGGGLSGLQPTEPYPHDLDRPPVSTAQYGIVQYSTSSPYLNCTIRYTLRFGSKFVSQLLILFYFYLERASASAAAASCTRWRGGPLAEASVAPCPAAPSTSRRERRRPAAKSWRGGPLAEASEAPCPVAPSTSRKKWRRPASRRTTPPTMPLLGRRRRYSNYLK